MNVFSLEGKAAIITGARRSLGLGIRVPSYTSSKSANKGLTMTLANECVKCGINAKAIAPGYMVTDNTELLRNDPVRFQEILNRIPAGRQPR